MKYRNNSLDMIQKNLRMMTLLVLIIMTGICCIAASERDGGKNTHALQDKVILASMAQKFRMMPFPSGDGFGTSQDYWFYRLKGYWEVKEIPNLFSPDLGQRFNVKWEDSRYEVFDKKTGNYLNIYGKKNWKTIDALVMDCNEFMEVSGRVACEFDGGNDHTMNLFTALLFNTTYHCCPR